MHGAQFPFFTSAAQLFASGLVCRCWVLSFPASQQSFIIIFLKILYFLISFWRVGELLVLKAPPVSAGIHSSNILQDLSQPQEPLAV